MPSPVHLDTNFLINYVGGGEEELVQRVEGWLTEGRTLHCSAIAWAEFQCGPLLPEESLAAEGVLHSVLPVTAELAVEAARLFRETGRRSRSLADCLIAATALREGAALATHNRDDFAFFLPHGLELVSSS